MDSTLNVKISSRSASHSGALFFSLYVFLLSITGIAWGAESAALNTEIGISALHFDYQEVDNSGRVLDKEQGGIPGLSLKVGQRVNDWEWESIASYHDGQVPYSGQTNLGTPYNTETREKIGDISLRLGRWFDWNYPVMPYAGIGYRRWDRDILPGSVNGLFESYRWNYIWVGSKMMVLEQQSSQVMLDIGLLKPLKPEMHIDFKGTFPISPIVYPESNLGLRAMLTSSIPLSQNIRLMIEPYFEYWKLGRSPNISSGTLTLYEPTSYTRNMGINLRLRWTH